MVDDRQDHKAQNSRELSDGMRWFVLTTFLGLALGYLGGRPLAGVAGGMVLGAVIVLVSHIRRKP